MMDSKKLILVALALVMLFSFHFYLVNWQSESRLKKRPLEERNTLKHTFSTFIIGASCFALFFGTLIYFYFLSDEKIIWWAMTIIGIFAILAARLMIACFVTQHEMNAKGLLYKTVFGKRVFIEWSKINKVHYSGLMKWYRIETVSGKAARISVLMMGLPEFARFLTLHINIDMMNLKTWQVLQATAKGKLPDVH